MKKIFFAFLLVVTSCKSVGVIESNNPQSKLNDGYRMLLDRRSIPAERLFIEANEIAKAGSDDSLTAKTFVALGDVYKFQDSASQAKSTYDFQQSLQNYKEAAKYLIKLKYNQRLSMAYWGIAQAYQQEKDSANTCVYINKAAQAYYAPSGGDNDKINQNNITSLIPYYEHSKASEFKAKCGPQ